MLSPVNDDEDLILEEENPEIYVHLENVLVHMIDMQDIAIFKSQEDYVRNKQKILEYLHYAQMWQVLSVIFSYAAFTCDNTDRILYKIPKDNASHAYSIYNYEHE